MPLPGVKSTGDEFQDIIDQSAIKVQAALLKMAKGIITGRAEEGRSEFREIFFETSSLADLFGRRRLILEFDAAERRDQPDTPNLLFAAFPKKRKKRSKDFRPDTIPKVPFDEAVESLAKREVRLARDVGEVTRAYARRAIPVTTRAEFAVLKRVNKAMADLLKKGVSTPKATQVLEEMTGWSRAYAETTWRTGVANAYTAGRFKKATDPVISKVIGAFKYQAVLDPDVRENHKAAHGLIAGPSDPIWNNFSPPIGINCRCTLRMVDRFELERLGLRKGQIVKRKEPPNFQDAHADEGFVTARPDKTIYRR